jgi:RsiW-degrading membrane proteinase PrsW (M82 family)
VEQRRDPWAPFRIWTALTVGVYAVRATFAATWVGAIPGWVLLLMLLLAMALAASAVLFPGRVIPWREGEPTGWWGRFLADRRLGRRRGSAGDPR